MTSDPLQGAQGLYEVIRNNALYNQDPGGFGILLHFWTKLSTYHTWLRILPFLFFIGTIISFIYLSYKWTKDIFIALLMGFIPIFFSSIIYTAFEIRAYSMEYFGAVLGIISLESIKSYTSNKKLFIWGMIFQLFVTSRYSF